jgi:hypothetical protein
LDRQHEEKCYHGHVAHTGDRVMQHHELVHYDPTSIANIMAFCKVLKDPTVCRVVYDSDVEDAFVIHKTDGTIFKFEATPGGLYAFKPQAPYIAANQARLQKQQTMQKDATNLHVSTVKENCLGYTERE